MLDVVVDIGDSRAFFNGDSDEAIHAPDAAPRVLHDPVGLIIIFCLNVRAIVPVGAAHHVRHTDTVWLEELPRALAL